MLLMLILLKNNDIGMRLISEKAYYEQMMSSLKSDWKID